MDTLDFNIYIENRRSLINRELQRIADVELERYGLSKLVQAMQYTVMADGKRLRPLLTIAIYELFDKDIENIIAPACSIELIHSASLMLDDLPCMDNATFRRKKQASHLVFGESATILASAALFTAAFKILSEIDTVKINTIIAETSDAIGDGGLIKGQFMDVETFGKASTIDELTKAYYLKTAVLFELAGKIGTTLAGSNEVQSKEISDLCRNLGLAYQIRDDILDGEQNFQELGKDVKIDEKNSKPTFLSMLGSIEAKSRLNALLEVTEKAIENLSKQNLQTTSLELFINNLKLK